MIYFEETANQCNQLIQNKRSNDQYIKQQMRTHKTKTENMYPVSRKHDTLSQCANSYNRAQQRDMYMIKQQEDTYRNRRNQRSSAKLRGEQTNQNEVIADTCSPSYMKQISRNNSLQYQANYTHHKLQDLYNKNIYHQNFQKIESYYPKDKYQKLTFENGYKYRTKHSHPSVNTKDAYSKQYPTNTRVYRNYSLSQSYICKPVSSSLSDKNIYSKQNEQNRSSSFNLISKNDLIHLKRKNLQQLNQVSNCLDQFPNGKTLSYKEKSNKQLENSNKNYPNNLAANSIQNNFNQVQNKTSMPYNFTYTNFNNELSIPNNLVPPTKTLISGELVKKKVYHEKAPRSKSLEYMRHNSNIRNIDDKHKYVTFEKRNSPYLFQGNYIQSPRCEFMPDQYYEGTKNIIKKKVIPIERYLEQSEDMNVNNSLYTRTTSTIKKTDSNDIFKSARLNSLTCPDNKIIEKNDYDIPYNKILSNNTVAEYIPIEAKVDYSNTIRFVNNNRNIMEERNISTNNSIKYNKSNDFIYANSQYSDSDKKDSKTDHLFLTTNNQSVYNPEKLLNYSYSQDDYNNTKKKKRKTKKHYKPNYSDLTQNNSDTDFKNKRKQKCVIENTQHDSIINQKHYNKLDREINRNDIGYNSQPYTANGHIPNISHGVNMYISTTDKEKYVNTDYLQYKDECLQNNSVYYTYNDQNYINYLNQPVGFKDNPKSILCNEPLKIEEQNLIKRTHSNSCSRKNFMKKRYDIPVSNDSINADLISFDENDFINIKSSSESIPNSVVSNSETSEIYDTTFVDNYCRRLCTLPILNSSHNSDLNLSKVNGKKSKIVFDTNTYFEKDITEKLITDDLEVTKKKKVKVPVTFDIQNSKINDLEAKNTSNKSMRNFTNVSNDDQTLSDFSYSSAGLLNSSRCQQNINEISARSQIVRNDDQGYRTETNRIQMKNDHIVNFENTPNIKYDEQSDSSYCRTRFIDNPPTVYFKLPKRSCLKSNTKKKFGNTGTKSAMTLSSSPDIF